MHKMISTRGVRFKFSEGEKVLCYEPDPTKAKVLYDSKVLELNVSRDDRGRKIPEYLIHFSGWSSTWDRCVKEEFILPDTEENRILQNKLAKEAATVLKARRKSKLPPLIKETLSKPEDYDEQPQSSGAKTDENNTSSETDSSDEETDMKVEINIPESLKEVLEEDWLYVTQKNKVINLPCGINVITILEGYVKHLAYELSSTSIPKNSKNESESVHDSIESKIHFAKETMHGIRVYFDFTLPHLLLYCQEKKQFYTIGNTCLPLSRTDRVSKKDGAEIVKSHPTIFLTNESTIVPCLEPCQNLIYRSGTRNQGPSQKSPNEVQAGSDEEMSDSSSPKLRAAIRVQQLKDVTSRPNKKIRMFGSRKGLRSGDKTKGSDDISNSHNITELEIEYSLPMQPESPPPTAASPPRQTRQSSQGKVMVQASAPWGRCLPNQRQLTSVPSITLSTQPVVTIMPLLSVSISNLSSSASSTHSSQLSPKTMKDSLLLTKNSSLCKEIENWKMVPDELYDQTPAAPSLVYGAHHLLRLFVKLPEFIYKAQLSSKTLNPLLNAIHDFLKYLEEYKDQFFHSHVYVDSGEDQHENLFGNH